MHGSTILQSQKKQSQAPSMRRSWVQPGRPIISESTHYLVIRLNHTQINPVTARGAHVQHYTTKSCRTNRRTTLEGRHLEAAPAGAPDFAGGRRRFVGGDEEAEEQDARAQDAQPVEVEIPSTYHWGVVAAQLEAWQYKSSEKTAQGTLDELRSLIDPFDVANHGHNADFAVASYW